MDGGTGRGLRAAALRVGSGAEVGFLMRVGFLTHSGPDRI